MEANLYQDIFSVLESHQNTIALKIPYGSPVTKIIFSSFDFMSGPELKFSWSGNYAEPSVLMEEQSDDSCSDRITSSSKQTSEELQYDESDFLATAFECTKSEKIINPKPDLPVNQVKTLSKDVGSSTLRSSSFEDRTLSLNNEAKVKNESYETDEQEHSSYTSVSIEDNENEENHGGTNDEHLKNSAMITSCVDSGITGTTSMHSNLSTCQSPKPVNSNNAVPQLIGELNSNSDQSDYGYCGDDVEKNEDCNRLSFEDKESLIDCMGKHATASFLSASSNVVGMSMLGASLEYDHKTIDEAVESQTFPSLRVESQKFEEYQGLSDEEFIAKFALAEQISSIQFDSNPIIPKISVVPNRQLMLCSYLFCAPDDVKSMMALSVVMPENAEDWFYAREKTFEEMFIDIITKMRASLMSETQAETICRVTIDFVELLNFWGVLERLPLLDTNNMWKIDLGMTYLDEYLDKTELDFIYKTITGCLLCQGCVVVIGNNMMQVDKMLLTLALFLQPSQRLLCSKSNSFHYNPYLKLQGLKRGETDNLYLTAGNSHWPVCFVDVDNKCVGISGTYFAQHARKQAMQIRSMIQIFKESNIEFVSGDELFTKRSPIINPIPFEIDPYVSGMLDAFLLLSSEQNERIAFIQHFHMTLDYKARAFIETVKELSEPSNNFKDSFVSSKWSLSTARRLLNLSNDTIFGIVMARADLLIPSFAQFIYQTTSLNR